MHFLTLVVGLVFTAVGLSRAGPPVQPENPVVGIFSSPLIECPPVPQHLLVNGSSPYNACVFSYSVRLLEAQGVRAVVFPWNMSYDDQLAMAKKVNGVWLPGGGMNFGPVYDDYLAAITRLYKIARMMNAQGDRFMLWGTCWGFEMLTIASAGGNQSVTTYPLDGMEPRMMSVNFTAAQPTSRMLGTATTPAEVLDAMQFKNATLNWHRQGVQPGLYDSNPLLHDAWSVLATTKEPFGPIVFVAAVEASNGDSIYGIQFHPERAPFEFANDVIGHAPYDIALSHYFARFMTQELRGNNHTFDSAEEVENHRVAQWPLDEIGWGIRTYFVIDPPSP